MECGLWMLVSVLVLSNILLALKIYLMRKSAREIREAFNERLNAETNTLISLSCHDPVMQQLADDINDQLRKLRSERQRFEQGNIEVQGAITNISHDLRTPLTAIYGYLDLLEQEEKSENVTRYVEVIRERTEALKKLTEELFSYSVVQSTLHELVYEELNLGSVLEESIVAYYAALKSHHIIPEISIPEQKVKRHLDHNALARIFGNIISNAIKYSDGDLKITLKETGEIIFTNHASNLDKVQVGRLFDRFFTVETANHATGLGLSITKILTEQMNGIITSKYEEGTVSICILFPEIKECKASK